ncbi:hypothetical protein [Pseudomonas sp. HS6]|uniref:hypothetical protein n=1 Tax=Pseudomonas sp. HS6 TaxID=2850559 RepID=UPI0020197477|nr:hypothetical protein [Pseudomonas sp. HS6]UQS12543.1 hypothetical protein JJN09_15010 [Pseudomonas sp. HS6]
MAKNPTGLNQTGNVRHNRNNHRAQRLRRHCDVQAATGEMISIGLNEVLLTGNSAMRGQ